MIVRTVSKKKDIAVLSGWALSENNNKYYISSVHYLYIQYLIEKFNHVYLILPVKQSDDVQNMESIDFHNVTIVGLPYYSGYIDSIFSFKAFYDAIKKVDQIEYFYCRVPDPYCWMPRLLFHKKTIMHFVGDSIEVIKTNKNFSFFKKSIYLFFYLPEYVMTLIASKASMSFSNGDHISKKLKMYGINVEPVISSTLVKEDFFEKEFITNKKLNLLYVGYIRYSKGVETLVEMMNILVHQNRQSVHLNLVGDGEAFEDIRIVIDRSNLQDHITLHGHVDDKNLLNEFYRNNDIFVFASLSEGSPRVVLEAMANSLPIIATPVGSLPSVFKDGEDILFANFEDPLKFAKIVMYVINNSLTIDRLVKNAFYKVKTNYTRDAFLNKIFGVFDE